MRQKLLCGSKIIVNLKSRYGKNQLQSVFYRHHTSHYQGFAGMWRKKGVKH
jgi:hypothetical protein